MWAFQTLCPPPRWGFISSCHHGDCCGFPPWILNPRTHRTSRPPTEAASQSLMSTIGVTAAAPSVWALAVVCAELRSVLLGGEETAVRPFPNQMVLWVSPTGQGGTSFLCLKMKLLTVQLAPIAPSFLLAKSLHPLCSHLLSTACCDDPS